MQELSALSFKPEDALLAELDALGDGGFLAALAVLFTKEVEILEFPFQLGLLALEFAEVGEENGAVAFAFGDLAPVAGDLGVEFADLSIEGAEFGGEVFLLTFQALDLFVPVRDLAAGRFGIGFGARFRGIALGGHCREFIAGDDDAVGKDRGFEGAFVEVGPECGADGPGLGEVGLQLFDRIGETFDRLGAGGPVEGCLFVGAVPQVCENARRSDGDDHKREVRFHGEVTVCPDRPECKWLTKKRVSWRISAASWGGGLELATNRPNLVAMQLPADAGIMVLNTVLFPHGILPLHIFEPRYRKMLAEALETDRMFVVAMQRPGAAEEAPCDVAGLGVVRYSVQRPNGTSDLVLQGIARVRLSDLVRQKPYRRMRITPLASQCKGGSSIDALVTRLVGIIEERVKQGVQVPHELLKQFATEAKAGGKCGAISHVADPGLFADFVACLFLRSRPAVLQTLLEDLNVESRLKHLIHFLVNEPTVVPNTNPKPAL